jgi:hypothetical protein
MTHLDTLNTSYGQEKGKESNWQFDSWPLKVRNHPNSLACKWRVTYHWKALNNFYNSVLDFTSIEGRHKKLWAPKVAGVPTLGILGLPLLGVSRKNDIWVLVPWLGIEYIIRGKVMASPKFGSWWILWIRGCSWLVRAPKCSNYALTNSWFGLCRSVWVIELFVNLPSPYPGAPAHPFTPNVMWAKERLNSFCCLHLWTRNWVHQGVLGCIKNTMIVIWRW